MFEYYQDSVDALRSVFTRLNLIVDGVACVKFADPEVKRILVSLFDTDKNGDINESEVSGITRIGRYNFSGNTLIKSFDEMKKLTQLNTIDPYSFLNCTNLKSVIFPDQLTRIGQQAFDGCSSLENVVLPKNLEILNQGNFNNCTALKHIELPQGITAISAFSNTGLEKIIIPDLVKSVGGFRYCSNLSFADIGSGVTTFDSQAFNDCPNLKIMIIRAVTPPQYNAWSLPESMKNNSTIYVPDASVDAYKTTGGWSGWASCYRPLSEYKG